MRAYVCGAYFGGVEMRWTNDAVRLVQCFPLQSFFQFVHYYDLALAMGKNVVFFYQER